MAGSLGAGEEQAVPRAGRGQTGAAQRAAPGRTAPGRAALQRLNGPHGEAGSNLLEGDAPTLPWQGGDLQPVTSLLIGL